MCVEAMHRLEFEKINGKGSFRCRAAAPRMLRRECIRERYWYEPEEKMESVWEPKKGCRFVCKMLDILKRIGGAPLTRAPPPCPSVLPIKDWKVYNWHDGTLNKEVAVRLLSEHGPCVGTIFCTLDYKDVDAYLDDKKVYRGCPRWQREELVERYGDRVGGHAVVCFAYRHRRRELQVLIMDNHSAVGPIRWIAFCEFDQFFAITVHPLDRPMPPTLYYPVSRCYT